MTIKEVVEVALAIVASLGSGGAIVAGLARFAGKTWADRSLAKYQHQFTQINIEFQNQLDLMARRVQVELDALSLIHKLRTQEEFTRLAELWKRMAELKSAFIATSPQGLHDSYSFADPQQQREFEEKQRERYGACVLEAQRYLAMEGLFVPKHICDVAQKAIDSALQDQIIYTISAPFLRPNTVPATPPTPDPRETIRENYYSARSGLYRAFVKDTNELEALMRAHIAGKEKDSGSANPAQ